METTISNYCKIFYIPAIQKLVFHLPHVRIIGTNHCGDYHRTAFMLDLPIGIDILMNLQTHQQAIARARAYAHGDYTNCLPIRDVRNTVYANLHRNYKL